MLLHDQITIQLLSSSLDVFFRKSNNLINKVQERDIRLITNDKYNEFSIYQRNLQKLMIELHKIIHQITPPIMNSLFVFHENTHNIPN